MWQEKERNLSFYLLEVKEGALVDWSCQRRFITRKVNQSEFIFDIKIRAILLFLIEDFIRIFIQTRG